MKRILPDNTWLLILITTLLAALTILAPPGAAQPALTTLHSFSGSPNDGANPAAGLAADRNGTLFGTTPTGGADNLGTVFELSPPVPPSEAWTEAVIHSFAGSDGSLVFGAWSSARTAGSTALPFTAGAFNAGTVFELTPPVSPSGNGTESVIYNFTGGSDGSEPQGTLIADQTGALYGTAFGGGTLNFGTVFALMPPASPGGVWTQTVLYSFTNTGDGADPTSGVAMGERGALYGSAGPTIFELTPPASPGNPWTEAAIGTTEPYQSAPQAGLVIGAGGVLYGTTLTGGEYRRGSVFEFTPPGAPGGAWTQTDIYNFYESPSVVGISPYQPY